MWCTGRSAPSDASSDFLLVEEGKLLDAVPVLRDPFSGPSTETRCARAISKKVTISKDCLAITGGSVSSDRLLDAMETMLMDRSHGHFALRAFVRYSDGCTVLRPVRKEDAEELRWCVAAVDEGPLGLEESGVVASLAQPLGIKGIPILYMSTYLTDYVLVLWSKRGDASSVMTADESTEFDEL